MNDPNTYAEQTAVRDLNLALLTLARQMANKDEVRTQVLFGLTPELVTLLASASILDIHAMVAKERSVLFSPQPVLREWLEKQTISPISVLEALSHE